MNPDHWCRDKAAPPGSSLHYSLLSLDPQRCRALIALYALRGELAGIVHDGRDPEVARSKLAWWGQELDGLFAARPRHPASQALAPHLEAFELSREPFRDLLAGVAMDLEYNAYPSFRELTQYGHRLGSAAGLLGARIQGLTEPATAQFAHHLGLSLLLLDRLLEVRSHARRGRFYLPEDELQQFGVSHADLLGRVTGPRLQALFHHQAERIRTIHRQALAALPARDRPRQRAHLVLARLKLALLDEVQAEGYRLLEQRTRLTPLRKLWLSWRALRRI